MKKGYFILFIFATLSLSSYCQYQIGVKGGYNYFKIIDRSNSDAHNYVTYSPDKNSYTASIFINNWIDTGRFISYQINYISYCFGMKASFGGLGSGGMVDYHYNLGYLQFAILPHFEFGKKWKFFIEPGFYFNCLINSHVEGTDMYRSAGNPNIYDTINQSAKDHFNTTAIGLKTGLGLDIPLNKRFNILIENCYSINLGSFDNGYWINFFNTSFEIGISYNLIKSNILNKMSKWPNLNNSSMK